MALYQPAAAQISPLLQPFKYTAAREKVMLYIPESCRRHFKWLLNYAQPSGGICANTGSRQSPLCAVVWFLFLHVA